MQFYIDEFEICNPLGSGKTLYKISAVYFTLLKFPLNIRYKSYQTYFYYLVNFFWNNQMMDVKYFLLSIIITVKLNNNRNIKFKIFLSFISSDNI